MSHRYFGAVAVLLLFASISSAQADQAAKAEKQKTANGQANDAPQKENAGDAIAALMGGAPIDKEAAERGRKIFVPACGFCHGNDAHGKSVYSSSRLVTLCLSRVRLPASEKFERGEVGEGLMGPYTVVGFLPASQLLVERGQLIGVGLHFVEFLIVRAVGALHVGVQLR